MSDIVFWRPPPNLNRRSNRRPKSPEPTRGRARTGARSRAPSSPCPMPQSLMLGPALVLVGSHSPSVVLERRYPRSPCKQCGRRVRLAAATTRAALRARAHGLRRGGGASFVTGYLTWARPVRAASRPAEGHVRVKGGRSGRAKRRGGTWRRSDDAAWAAGAPREDLPAALACEWPQSGIDRDAPCHGLHL